MDIFQFVWSTLAWTVTVAALWPLNVPMAALSFRIWRETKESDIEGTELWFRAFLASTSLAILTILFVAIDWAIADVAEFPAGPVHLAVLLGLLAAASGIVVYIFSLEDFFQGVSLVIIYLYLPVIALWLLNALLGLINSSLRFWDPILSLASYGLVKPST